MKNRRNKYCEIKNMHQLHAERDKLEMMVKLREMQLHQVYCEIKSQLTFSNISNHVISHILSSTFIGRIVTGYKCAMYAINKCKEGIQRQQNSEYCE